MSETHTKAFEATERNSGGWRTERWFEFQKDCQRIPDAAGDEVADYGGWLLDRLAQLESENAALRTRAEQAEDELEAYKMWFEPYRNKDIDLVDGLERAARLTNQVRAENASLLAALSQARAAAESARKGEA